MQIDAKKLPYKQLNEEIRQAIRSGEKEIILHNVNGHRYIGDNLGDKVKIIINGVPGQDLAFCMNGPEIIVNSNAQDGVGNTMSSGKIIIHGNAGDICGYAMNGGKIFIKGSVGYRSGIHMKEYKDNFPIIVVGNCAGDFFGEYMAGGVLIVLGLNEKDSDIVGNLCGTGMHAGKMFIRGQIPTWKLGKEVRIEKLTDQDILFLDEILKEYGKDLELNLHLNYSDFVKLIPGSLRPYGHLYAY